MVNLMKIKKDGGCMIDGSSKVQGNFIILSYVDSVVDMHEGITMLGLLIPPTFYIILVFYTYDRNFATFPKLILGCFIIYIVG